MVFRGLAFAKYTVEKNPETLGFGNKNWSQHLFVMRTSGLGEFLLGTPASTKHGATAAHWQGELYSRLGIDV